MSFLTHRRSLVKRAARRVAGRVTLLLFAATAAACVASVKPEDEAALDGGQAGVDSTGSGGASAALGGSAGSGPGVGGTTGAGGTPLGGTGGTLQGGTGGGCGAGMFACGSGECIPSTAVCDGLVTDCADGSDEAAALCGTTGTGGTTGCVAGQFECDNGQCIPAGSVCDGVPNVP